MTKLDLPPDKYSEKQALRSCLAGLRFRSLKGVWVESKDLLNAWTMVRTLKSFFVLPLLRRIAFCTVIIVGSIAVLPGLQERLSALRKSLQIGGAARVCNTKSGVLEYCLREELRNKVASHAIKSKAGTWLEHIQSSPLLDNFSCQSETHNSWAARL